MEKDQVEHPSGQDRQHNQSSNPYDEDDQVQPKLHARTYVAAIAMCVLSFNQTFALYGVATAVSAFFSFAVCECRLTSAALLDRRGSRRTGRPVMGAECRKSHISRHGPSRLLRLGCVPAQEATPHWRLSCCLCRVCHHSWSSEPCQNHCWAAAGWFWFLGDSAGVLRPQ